MKPAELVFLPDCAFSLRHFVGLSVRMVKGIGDPDYKEQTYLCMRSPEQGRHIELVTKATPAEVVEALRDAQEKWGRRP